MSNLLGDEAGRISVIGNGPVSKASGTLTHGTTKSLFTVTGEVLITALWLKCTTTMAGANTLAVNCVPTAGNTMTLVTATDLGSTDTVAGSVVGLTQPTTAVAWGFLVGGRTDLNAVVTTGVVGLVQTGSGTIDGAVTVYCTWVPLTDGASLVAA